MINERVSIIIPNFNGWKDTIECLQTIFNLQTDTFFLDVIIVDNASTDESVKMINNWIHSNGKVASSYQYEDSFEYQLNMDNNFSTLILIKNKKNNGFAGALNFGIKYINKSKKRYDYIWFLNNDTIVDDNSLIYLLEYAKKNPQCGMIGTTIIEYYDKTKIQVGGGSRYNAILTINKPNLSGFEINVLERIRKAEGFDYVCGASMFVPFNVITKVGMFNENYFLYYEELDYAKRLEQFGYKLGWSQKSIIYHKGGSSAGSRSLNNKKSIQAEYYSNLSALKFSSKFYKKYFWLILTNRFILKSIFFLKNREIYLFKPLYRAFYDFFLNERIG
ncbi:glycosyltransferase family 2 protein [Heyndrickxia coagulans]|uniref:glycosyltransferase family 2 protein n=1 Tax=Heyndrickxia coagulans TaxID=1398 RepID=UPI0003616006|nr:glycosyltransferase family 2 protein [Heyndrickxia coagulans]